MSKSENNRLTKIELEALCDACGLFTAGDMEGAGLNPRSPHDRAIWEAIRTAQAKLYRRAMAMGGFRDDGRLDPPDDDDDE